MTTATITVTLPLAEGTEVTPEVRDALDCLAAIMLVQAEDGLYTGGSPDAEPGGEHLADFAASTVEVTLHPTTEGA